ncbi:conserved membrane hypothetical protein [Burkholderiales bacterium]|nr:conserved membrane hypothetical protein [Burkholderiales bacterium]
MKVVDRPPGRDPLGRMGGALVALLLAVVLSVLLAALAASQVPGSYAVRAYSYFGLLAWVLAGAVLLFRITLAAESAPFTMARLAKWMISIWLWPLLLLGRRRARDAARTPDSRP